MGYHQEMQSQNARVNNLIQETKSLRNEIEVHRENLRVLQTQMESIQKEFASLKEELRNRQ